MIVLCQICKMEIAETSVDELSVPINGSMFHPHRAGFPEPFPGGPDWMYIRCRYCRTRPFLRDDEILTTKGIFCLDIKGVITQEAEMHDYSDDVTNSDPETEKIDSEFVYCAKCAKQYHNTPKGLHWYNKHIESCNA